MEPSSSAHSSQICGFKSCILLDFLCQIQRISSVADLIAVGLSVSAGNSSERSYLFTTPNVLIVYAGEPSSQRARTVSPSVENPSVRIFSHIFTNSLSALLMPVLLFLPTYAFLIVYLIFVRETTKNAKARHKFAEPSRVCIQVFLFSPNS